MSYNKIFNRLWSDYIHQNPSSEKIYNMFVNSGEMVQNDHIAFRTFNDPRMNIDVLSKVFLTNGYIEKGEYVFQEKHLFAKHYEHISDVHAPRVFISQLIIEDFSPSLQKIIRDTINTISSNIFESEELIFAGSLFQNLSYISYQKLLEESEYAAWLYVFGFRANHFTVSINALKKFDTIEKVNEFIKSGGFLLNNSGGEIKGTEEDLLRQSSTLADRVKIRFLEGEFEIPSCYYEFAQRFPDPSGRLYSGFVAKSADKIFESTNFKRNN